jgi:RHS repeat-associated protein
MRREIDYDDLDRVVEVRRFVPPGATSPTNVETYAYNALGGFSIYDNVVMDDERPRLDGGGTASAGVAASLNGDLVTLDPGGRVVSFNGQSFQYFKTDHRLKAILNPARNQLFVYDTLGRLLQIHSQAPGLGGGAPGAADELFYYNGTDDSIAAEAVASVSEPTPITQPHEPPPEPATLYQVIDDGIDQPLWVVNDVTTAIYELDTTGNVRHLHAGQRFSSNYPDGDDPSYSGDLGGYAYSAFGKRLGPTEVPGLAAPVGVSQPFTWQGKRALSTNLYYSRARIWSADLGVFLQPDGYGFLSRGGTLWSWPGQNPFRWADPSGRFAPGPAAGVAAAELYFSGWAAYAIGYFAIGPVVFAQQDANLNAIAKAAAQARENQGRPNPGAECKPEAGGSGDRGPVPPSTVDAADDDPLRRFDGPKPKYSVNDAHVPGRGLRPGKTPLPGRVVVLKGCDVEAEETTMRKAGAFGPKRGCRCLGREPEPGASQGEGGAVPCPAGSGDVAPGVHLVLRFCCYSNSTVCWGSAGFRRAARVAK